MGEDELISDERCEQEDLNSDEQVRTSKERMLTAAKNITGEIHRTFHDPSIDAGTSRRIQQRPSISEENTCLSTQQETTPRPI